MSKTKVMIALSGGVDSSAAAQLMLQAGYDCVGATMCLHDPTDTAQDARAVAEKLQIPFYHLDRSQAFRNLVMDDFVAAK